MTTGTRLTVTAAILAGLAGLLAVIPLAGDGGPDVDDGFVIDRFDREVVVAEDGTVDVTETIGVTFLEERRGIFRDLETAGVGTTEAAYEVASVDRGSDGDDWTWTVESADDDVRVRIGDPDVELEPGPQTYRLRYTATGQVAVDADDPGTVEVRIDVPGLGWPTTVAATSLTLDLPGEPTEVTCVVGAADATAACPETGIDGDRVTQPLPALEPATTGTVAVRLPADAFDTASVPTTSLVPLGTPDGDAAEPPPLEVPLPVRGLLVGLALALPIAAFEGVRSRRVYRDQVTDPALHDRAVPTAELAPPDGLPPTDLSVVLQRLGDGEDRFLATLVDLEQRGVVTSRTTADPDGDEDDVAVVEFAPGTDPAAARPFEAAFLEALFAGTGGIRFDGEYDEAVAERVTAATTVLTERQTEMRRPGAGIVHDGGGWFRGGRALLTGAVAVGAGVLLGLGVASVVGLSTLGLVLSGIAVVVAWALLGFAWRYHRQALTSYGRHLSARVRAYRTFLTEVHRDQLDFGAERGVHHLHPAVALLPYAIALGLADSWYDRFGPVIAELATASRGSAAATAAPVPWWAYAGGYAGFRTTQQGTVTDPAAASSGGAGGGGAGSGGGGGGGGSW